jgi:FkbM family methyltransferase
MMSALQSLKFIARHPLNRHEPWRGIRRFMAWQIATRLHAGAIAVPFVDDTRLLVSRAMHGATGNVYCGLHEYEDMAFVLHALRRGELFIDVGANIGSYTVLAAGVVGARTVAFEPAPAAYRALLDNIRLNNLGDLVEARNEGVGAERGRLNFTTDLDTVNHVVASAARANSCAHIPITTLDTALEVAGPCVIKVDVEGYESAVVMGAERTFSAPAVMAVLMELNGSATRYGFDEQRLHGHMLELGYFPVRYDPLARQLRANDAGPGTTGNLLYIRDPEFMQARVVAAPRRRVHGTFI